MFSISSSKAICKSGRLFHAAKPEKAHQIRKFLNRQVQSPIQSEVIHHLIICTTWEQSNRSVCTLSVHSSPASQSGRLLMLFVFINTKINIFSNSICKRNLSTMCVRCCGNGASVCVCDPKIPIKHNCSLAKLQLLTNKSSSNSISNWPNSGHSSISGHRMNMNYAHFNLILKHFCCTTQANSNWCAASMRMHLPDSSYRSITIHRSVKCRAQTVFPTYNKCEKLPLPDELAKFHK